MIFLINCSNLKAGGGLQVADSICSKLYKFPYHHFVVVLSSYLQHIKTKVEGCQNVEVWQYDIKNRMSNLLLGRDKFLDSLVKEKQIDAVLTIFGPSRWRPRCPHVCGFARAQLLLKDSPYYKEISWKTKLKYQIWKWAFKKSSKIFFTENAYISAMLPSLLGKSIKVYTVTNYYNQVFDHPEQWKKSVRLPKFDGVTLVTVSTNAPHKNLKIIPAICEALTRKHPDFRYRFALTISKEQCQWHNGNSKNHVLFLGKVDISECPYIYDQADIMFMPTLMECFSATYPEAMRMNIPIITTDLEFAHSLCGKAAIYYSSTNANEAADAIYQVATNDEYRKSLTDEGKQQLMCYDNYDQRAEKLVNILAKIS